MQLNRVECALDMVERMLRARAAAQLLLKDKYGLIIGGFKSQFRENMAEEKKSPVEILCDRAEKVTDQNTLIWMLAATIELVEEDARCAGLY
jgi:hypothetical protein